MTQTRIRRSRARWLVAAPPREPLPTDPQVVAAGAAKPHLPVLEKLPRSPSGKTRLIRSHFDRVRHLVPAAGKMARIFALAGARSFAVAIAIAVAPLAAGAGLAGVAGISCATTSSTSPAPPAVAEAPAAQQPSVQIPPPDPRLQPTFTPSAAT